MILGRLLIIFNCCALEMDGIGKKKDRCPNDLMEPVELLLSVCVCVGGERGGIEERNLYYLKSPCVVVVALYYDLDLLVEITVHLIIADPLDLSFSSIEKILYIIWI